MRKHARRYEDAARVEGRAVEDSVARRLKYPAQRDPRGGNINIEVPAVALAVPFFFTELLSVRVGRKLDLKLAIASLQHLPLSSSSLANQKFAVWRFVAQDRHVPSLTGGKKPQQNIVMQPLVRPAFETLARVYGSAVSVELEVVLDPGDDTATTDVLAAAHDSAECR